MDNQNTTCPSCGAPLFQRAAFCSHCGASVPGSAPPAQQAFPGAGPAAPPIPPPPVLNQYVESARQKRIPEEPGAMGVFTAANHFAAGDRINAWLFAFIYWLALIGISFMVSAPASFVPQPLQIPFQLSMGLVATAFLGPIQMGMFKGVLAAYDGGRLDTSQLFSEFSNFQSAVIISLVANLPLFLVQAASSFLFLKLFQTPPLTPGQPPNPVIFQKIMVPVMIVGAYLLLPGLAALIIKEGLEMAFGLWVDGLASTPGGALSKAWKITKANWWLILKTGIVMFLVYLAGLIVICVGWLALLIWYMPLTVLIHPILYRACASGK